MNEFTGMQQIEGGVVRRYDYEDRMVLVADLGAGVDGAVDVVGSTAIVVAGDDQHEFDLPEGETAQAYMKNGVVTIEVEG